MHVNPFSSSKAHQDGLDLGQNKEMEKKTYLQILLFLLLMPGHE